MPWARTAIHTRSRARRRPRAPQLTLAVPLPPAYTGRELEGAVSGLHGMLTRFHAGLGGVLLAFSRPRFATAGATRASATGGGAYVRSGGGARPLGRIFDELPVVHVRVTVDALLFRPALGQRITGVVTGGSAGHVSLLVGGLFNATVLEGDMGGAYAFDDARDAWVGVAGGGAAGLPAELAVGASLPFYVTRIAHSGGIVQLFGSLSAAASAPAEAAYGGGGGGARRGRGVAADAPPAPPAATADGPTDDAEGGKPRKRKVRPVVEAAGTVEDAADDSAAAEPPKKKKKPRKADADGGRG